MMRTTLLAATFALALAVALALPSATAHGAPEPKDKETRLLEDWLDDCGGDGGAASGGCKGSIDLLALDIQESYDPNLGDTAILRLYADKGQASSQPHKLIISLRAPSGLKSFSVQTSDDSKFTHGGGFDKLGPAQPIPGEATRFFIEGTVKLSTLGKVGDKLTAFRVDSITGAGVGDFMPGGCHNTVGDCVSTPGQDLGNYTRPEYVLRGPVQYVRLDVPAGVQQVAAGSERIVDLPVANLLSDQAQSVFVNVAGAEGVQARFHNPGDHSGTGYTASGQVDLPAKGTSVLHLSLTGLPEGAHGTLTLTLLSDLGGHVVKEMPYQVTAASTSSSGTCPAATGVHGMTGMETCATSTTKASPPLAAATALVALALIARARRS